MRPGGLTAVCVIGLTLAIMGIMSFGFGCLGLLAQPFIQEFTAQMQRGMPGNMGAMQEEIQALQSRWMPYNIANVVLNGIGSSLLLAGSILGLRMSPRTNQWFVPGLVCGILHAILYIGLQAMMQHEMQAVMARQMAQIMQQGPTPAPPGAAAMTSNVMKMSSAIGIVFAGGWGLLQIGFYATAIWYLLRRDVRNLFTPPPLDELAAEPTVGGMP